MSFTIIIPTRNLTNLIACVGTIRAAGETAKVIVVDDGLEEMSMAQAEALAPFEQVAGLQPFCFARSVNIGIRMAAPDDVFLWNDDALLQDRGAETPLTNLARAVAYSTFEYGKPWGIVSAGVSGHAGTAFPLSMQQARDRFRGLAYSLWPVRVCNGSRMVPFVAVFIPRKTINIVGLLDERYTGTADGHEVYGGEDDDYCYRARRAGFLVGVWDGCVVDHATLKSTFRPDGKGRSIEGARARFREIHGFQMGTL